MSSSSSPSSSSSSSPSSSSDYMPEPTPVSVLYSPFSLPEKGQAGQTFRVASFPGSGGQQNLNKRKRTSTLDSGRNYTGAIATATALAAQTQTRRYTHHPATERYPSGETNQFRVMVRQPLLAPASSQGSSFGPSGKLKAKPPKSYDDSKELLAALRTTCTDDPEVDFSGSYLVPGSEAGTVSDKQRVQTVSHDIWKATGYRFTVKDHPPTERGHKTRLWCSQDEARRSKHRGTGEVPRVSKQGELFAKKRFNCRSRLMISCIPEGVGARRVTVRMHHYERHERYFEDGAGGGETTAPQVQPLMTATQFLSAISQPLPPHLMGRLISSVSGTGASTSGTVVPHLMDRLPPPSGPGSMSTSISTSVAPLRGQEGDWDVPHDPDPEPQPPSPSPSPNFNSTPPVMTMDPRPMAMAIDSRFDMHSAPPPRPQPQPHAHPPPPQMTVSPAQMTPPQMTISPARMTPPQMTRARHPPQARPAQRMHPRPQAPPPPPPPAHAPPPQTTSHQPGETSHPQPGQASHPQSGQASHPLPGQISHPPQPSPPQMTRAEFEHRMHAHIARIRDFCDGLEYQVQFNDHRMLAALERDAAPFLGLLDSCLREEGR
ncbi:hypothetical protein C8R43DRAFT_976713 [Mycena crocata]|nr:hypothetical protein C8R43DRAFT_976713 [Mycena crocata]